MDTLWKPINLMDRSTDKTLLHLDFAPLQNAAHTKFTHLDLFAPPLTSWDNQIKRLFIDDNKLSHSPQIQNCRGGRLRSLAIPQSLSWLVPPCKKPPLPRRNLKSRSPLTLFRSTHSVVTLDRYHLRSKITARGMVDPVWSFLIAEDEL